MRAGTDTCNSSAYDPEPPARAGGNTSAKGVPYVANDAAWSGSDRTGVDGGWMRRARKWWARGFGGLADEFSGRWHDGESGTIPDSHVQPGGAAGLCAD